MKSQLWPNFFVVGAAKAGTTSIYAGLRQHPDIFMSYPKEPHHFTQVQPPHELRWHFEAHAEPERYLRLFEGSRGFAAVGEASTSYLWHPEVARRISRQVPDARIIIALRDPIERAYSHYLMHVREGIQPLGFYDALVEDLNRTNESWALSHFYVGKGQYARQVRRYLDVFARDRVKIVLFDDLKRDPEAEMRDIARFLGLGPVPIAGADISRAQNPYRASRGRWAEILAGSKLSRMLGETIVPRRLGSFIYEHMLLKQAHKPPMDSRAGDLLLEFYGPEISELERMLGRQMPELRRTWPLAEESLPRLRRRASR
ncbi:MAG TPA: sulfotransferase [Candidatus Binataceae bacterium]|nr:sulfotransferase [Candidatus Binataceae bacterium]